jgi:hypothetical protein
VFQVVIGYVLYTRGAPAERPCDRVSSARCAVSPQLGPRLKSLQKRAKLDRVVVVASTSSDISIPIFAYLGQ